MHMICNVCGKNEAAIHFKAVIGSSMVTLNICEMCAMQKKADIAFDTAPFSIADIVQGLTEIDTVHTARKKEHRRCPICHSTFEDFKKTGKFGCALCYQTFRESIELLLKKIHGSTRHTGKAGAVSFMSFSDESKKSIIKRLQDDLAEAVRTERFEVAATLRDRIRSLEKSGNSQPV